MYFFFFFSGISLEQVAEYVVRECFSKERNSIRFVFDGGFVRGSNHGFAIVFVVLVQFQVCSNFLCGI